MKTSSKNIFNLALSILWYLGASSKNVLATDDHIVYCDGIFSQHYCNCEEDCDSNPEHCECELAQECCSERSERSFTLDSFLEGFGKEFGFIHEDHYGTILCPGQAPSEYCDCGGDCTAHPEWCGCEEAIACCKDSTPVVLCPGQPAENYCDCTGDCLMRPEWCQCGDAKKCCGESESTPYESSYVLLDAALAEPAETDAEIRETFAEAAKEIAKIAEEGFELEEGIVFCPRSHSMHYCDCEGDCNSNSEACSCGLAEDCCSQYVRKIRLRIFLSIAIPVILLLCCCLGYRASMRRK